MSEQSPDVRWAPIEPKPRNRGRLWLIIGLVVAALVIIGALLFFLLPRAVPAPGASGSPDPSTSEPATGPDGEPAPQTSPPAPVEPTLDVFREQVGGWLAAAPRGLDIIAQTGGADALSVVDTLEQDAVRLSGAPAPSSIASQWSDGVSAYLQRLAELRSALTDGSDSASATDEARSAVQNLLDLAGL
jgi:hypothetical protein